MSVVSCQLSVVSCQLSVASCQLSVVSSFSLTTDYRPPTTDHRSLTKLSFCLFITLGVSSKGASRGKFTQFVSDHLI
ncbi:hypothetical protein [Argonema antarcticum]|uniref:hypothetical protein n=1 Tax=Argonema antarcticum TaxID=2942763 RepID=UPI002013442D|nr:hypothetical protein [Argonema antarcticum]MCL1471293.1 hypothetical protein [Argonema antarcticum A004/B2]